MFRAAYEKVCKFTFPVLHFALTVEGKCSAGTAAFIVVNDDGWIVTAAHVMKQAVDLAQSDTNARMWEVARDAIRADTTISAKERSKRLSSLRPVENQDSS